MNLSIIIPTNKNKELIRKISKESHEDDEIITVKVTSKNVQNVLLENIENCRHNNILLINTNDNKCLKNGFLDKFRKEGIFANNLKQNKVSRTTTIKFTKDCYNINSIKESDIKNINTFIDCIYNNIIIKENYGEVMKKKGRGTNPKILFVCDVKDWAWWLKTQYLKRYLSDEFNIDMINIVEKPQKIDPKKYDLYFTYGYSYIDGLVKNKVPKDKRITGVTAHRDNKVLKRPLSQADYVHANSMLLKNQIKPLHRNIYYTPNGVDADMFYKRNEYDLLDRDYITMGHVGKKSPMKCQQTIIEPVAEKLKQYNIRYIPHYNDYRDKIPHTKMPDLYQNMDLFIVASIEDGTPNGALEAMASGVPVISNRIGNMPEVIINGYNGYIVKDWEKIDSYVDLIKNLDKEHIIEMGKNARQTIENGWTWEIQAENYRYMFKDILGM